MSATPVEVVDWTKQAPTFTPTMTATIGAAPADALAAVEVGLATQGYRIKSRTGNGFVASHRKLVSGILGLVTATHGGLADRTLLAVAADPTAEGTRLTITVTGGGEHRGGRKGAAAGLTAAFQDLQRRGATVATTPWVKG